MSNFMSRSSSSDANISTEVENTPLCMEPQGSLTFHLQNSQPLVPNLSQLNPNHIIPNYLIKIHVNITLRSASRASK
jgi:hypothetical protein